MPEARGILRSSGQKDRDRFLRASTTSRRTSDQTGDPLPFRHWDLILIILCTLRICTPQIVCPRSHRACISPVLTGMLRFQIQSRQQLSIAFCPRSLNHTFSILCARIFTRPTKPSLSSCRNLKRMRSVLPSLFTTRFCQQ